MSKSEPKATVCCPWKKIVISSSITQSQTIADLNNYRQQFKEQYMAEHSGKPMHLRNICSNWQERVMRSDQRQRDMSPFRETDHDKTLKLAAANEAAGTNLVSAQSGASALKIA